MPKYTLRQSGVMMTTVWVRIHIEAELVKWTAEKLGVAETTALKRLRKLFESQAGAATEWHVPVIQRDENGKIRLSLEHIDDARTYRDEGDVEDAFV